MNKYICAYKKNIKICRCKWTIKTYKHSLAPKDLSKNFSILMKSMNKFVYEMFFIQKLRPTLNVQSYSIRAKVFN